MKVFLPSGWVRLVPPAVVVLAGIAAAYVPPAFSILRRLVEKRDESQIFTLKIDGTVTLFRDETGQRAEVQREGTFMLKLPGRCRFELAGSSAKIVAVHARGRDRTEGKEMPALATLIDEVCAFLGSRSSSAGEGRALMENHLRDLKILLQRTSLGRLNGQVAYVIGEERESSPQFWAYKDTFLPARIRFADSQGRAWDIRFLDFSSPITGDWFPRNIELYQQGELLLRFTALHTDPRASLPDRLF